MNTGSNRRLPLRCRSVRAILAAQCALTLPAPWQMMHQTSTTGEYVERTAPSRFGGGTYVTQHDVAGNSLHQKLTSLS